MNTNVMFSSATDLWATPQDFFDKLNAEFHFTLDPCYCANCRKYEECRAKGVFDEDPGFDFCVNYEDVSYPDDDNDEND